jgi:hypothetical protein
VSLNRALLLCPFRKIAEKYGLFKRVIVDHGAEFFLSLFMQQYYWMLLQPDIREEETYKQTRSVIVRFWKNFFFLIESFSFLLPEQPNRTLLGRGKSADWIPHENGLPANGDNERG